MLRNILTVGIFIDFFTVQIKEMIFCDGVNVVVE